MYFHRLRIKMKNPVPNKQRPTFTALTFYAFPPGGKCNVEFDFQNANQNEEFSYKYTEHANAALKELFLEEKRVLLWFCLSLLKYC